MRINNASSIAELPASWCGVDNSIPMPLAASLIPVAILHTAGGLGVLQRSVVPVGPALLQRRSGTREE